MMDRAIGITKLADIFIVVGTSLIVYPAAGLVDFVAPNVKKYVVDPKMPALHDKKRFDFITAPAAEGIPRLVEDLLNL